MDKQIQTELEAAAFRRLVEHLLADFCRNCLAKWYAEAAKDKGVELDYDLAREIIYGMPYADWKKRHQTEATPEQLAAYELKQQGKKHE